MQAFIIELMSHFGYIGVFLLITIENIFPPIPSELILTFGGFMTLSSAMSVWGVILASTLGSVAGAVILYLIGTILNEDRLDKLISSRFGRFARLKQGDFVKTGSWFSRFGNKAILLGRFIPIVRSLISIPAGMAKMNMKTFLLLTTLGTLVWNTVLVFAGRLAGAAWDRIHYYTDIYSAIAGVALAVAAVIVVFLFIKKRFLAKQSRSQAAPSGSK